MNLASWTVLGAVAAALAFAVYKMIASHRAGKCAGCSGCPRQGKCSRK